ncbi:MAG: hypothetical protein KDD50_06570 [Bdellovibrionales bacterium]|nr:hypothetical protein [Bdellovibrionales bacterium]
MKLINIMVIVVTGLMSIQTFASISVPFVLTVEKEDVPLAGQMIDKMKILFSASSKLSSESQFKNCMSSIHDIESKESFYLFLGEFSCSDLSVDKYDDVVDFVNEELPLLSGLNIEAMNFQTINH